MLVKDLFCEKPVVKLHTVIKIFDNYYVLCKITINKYHFVCISNGTHYMGKDILETDKIKDSETLFTENEVQHMLNSCYEFAEYIGQFEDVFTRSEKGYL